MSDFFLGIDTSNYTTSVSVYSGGEIINRKKLLPVKEGERGVRQSDAVFHHVKQLPEVCSDLLRELPQAPVSVGVSDAPRNVSGSYMPCFSVGVSFAQVLSSAYKIPMDRFSHQQGHIAAALYSADKLELIDREFIAFHVSGGTTEALCVKPDAQGMPDPRLIAASLDLKAGQAIDRVGVMLGMRFPCGPELERLALSHTDRIRYKPVIIGDDCSLSGLENKCSDMLKQGRPKEEIARFCIEAVSVTLDTMCERLLKKYGELPVLFSGGVCSNSIIRNALTEKYGAFFATPEFSSDNAAGIAILTKIKRTGI